MSILVKPSPPTYVAADNTQQKTVTVTAGGTVYYKATSDVSASDTAIELGKSATFTAGQYLISASTSKVAVDNVSAGVVPSSPVPGFYGGQWAPNTATSGTDTTPAEKKLFVSSLFLPVSKKIKGIGFLVGSVGGTNKAVVGLFNSAGTLVAKSSETTEGTLVGTAAEIQEINLTAEYNAIGPGVYYIGVTMNGNTARLRTIPKNTAGANVFSTEATLSTKNVLASITAPTAFTADKGPVCWVY